MVSTVPNDNRDMERELKPGEWLDNMDDPDVVAEFNQMCDALGAPKATS
ncbi:MAG: hypothetical protein WCC03_01845 [Candidatus Acidiferrales bacterium]